MVAHGLLPQALPINGKVDGAGTNHDPFTQITERCLLKCCRVLWISPPWCYLGTDLGSKSRKQVVTRNDRPQSAKELAKEMDLGSPHVVIVPRKWLRSTSRRNEGEIACEEAAKA